MTCQAGVKKRSQRARATRPLHYILPALVPPIDREYTIRFFLHNKTLFRGDKAAFLEIFPYFHRIATEAGPPNEGRGPGPDSANESRGPDPGTDRRKPGSRLWDGTSKALRLAQDLTSEGRRTLSRNFRRTNRARR
jgi:hypothetical protein